MKLVFKLMFAFICILIVLLVFYGFLSVRSDQEMYLSDMKQDARFVGYALVASIENIWLSHENELIHKLIEETNMDENVHIGLVWLDAYEGSPYYAPLNSVEKETLLHDKEVVIRRKDSTGEEFLISYIPFQFAGIRPGAIELKESLSPMHKYVASRIIRMTILIGALVLFGGLLILVLGVSMVGRPVEYLVEQARQVGNGNLEGTIVLRRRKDELSYLADEMNIMIEQLRESRLKLESETAKRIEALEQLSHAERLAAIGKITSGIAHELGTPMNVISGRAKMISSKEAMPPDVVDNARIIKQQSDRMTKIIRQLLNFSRPRKLHKKTFDINTVTQRIVTVLRPIAEKENITFNFDDENDEKMIHADENQIEEVLTNLVMNAIHAMPQGGVINVRAKKEHIFHPDEPYGRGNDYISLNVTDSGEGISNEHIERIFEPFFTTKRASEGTGLGLSIAQSIIREHGGWMTVESEPGNGSSFTIYLPAGSDE